MLRRPLDRIELKPEDKKEPQPLPRSKILKNVYVAKADASTQSTAATASVTEEVEVKLRLMTKEDHAKAKSLFVTSHVATYDQENYFFDGRNQELSSRRQIMRIRFYNRVQKAVLTMKGRASLADGIGRAMEEEEDVDCATARKCLDDPDLILELQSDLVQRVKSTLGVSHLVSLGGFENVRDEYEWEGFKLEIDETIYDFGTNYEIECETDKPEELRDRLEKLFTDNQIRYQYRTSTKFACFMKKSLED